MESRGSELVFRYSEASAGHDVSDIAYAAMVMIYTATRMIEYEERWQMLEELPPEDNLNGLLDIAYSIIVQALSDIPHFETQNGAVYRFISRLIQWSESDLGEASSLA